MAFQQAFDPEHVTLHRPPRLGAWWQLRFQGAVISVQPTLLDAMRLCQGLNDTGSCQECANQSCLFGCRFAAPAAPSTRPAQWIGAITHAVFFAGTGLLRRFRGES